MQIKGNHSFRSCKCGWIIKTPKKLILSNLIKLFETKEQLDSFTEKLSNDERFENKETYYGIMYVLGQNYFFSVEDKGLTVKELSAISGKSKQSLRVALKNLIELGVLSTKGKRPIIYSIDEKYFEE